MNSLVVAKRLVKEISNDKRTVAMFFLAPLFIISLLFIVLNNGVETVTIGVTEETTIAFDDENVVEKVILESDKEHAIQAGVIDAFLDSSLQEMDVLVEGTDPSVTGKVLQSLQKGLMLSLEEKMKEKKIPVSIPEINVNYLYGREDLSSFDRVAPFMMGFVVFFLVFLLSGIAFLRERISGTMTRMMATAVRRRDIVLGYMLGFGFFVTIQTILLQMFMTFVLKVHFEGNYFLALLINMIVAVTSLTLGLFLSAFARNEFQLLQFIPLVIVPQTLFAGLFPLRELPMAIQWLSKIFPLTYAGEALREVMLRGKGIDSVYDEMLILLGFFILFLGLNIRALKKYRNA